MSVSIPSGNNDPYRVPSSDGDFSLMDALRVGPLTGGDHQQQFADALKRITEKKLPPPAPKTDAERALSHAAAEAPPRRPLQEKSPSRQRSSETLENDRQQPTSSRDDAHRVDERQTVGEEKRAEQTAQDKDAHSKTKNLTHETDAHQPQRTAVDRNAAVYDDEESYVIIACDFGCIDESKPAAADEGIPYGDDMMILPFPTRESSAPKSLVDVFSAQPSAETDESASADERLRLLATVQQSTADENVALPASFAQALAGHDVFVSSAPADIEASNIAADAAETDSASLDIDAEIPSPVGETDDQPTVLSFAPVDGDSDTTTEKAPQVHETLASWRNGESPAAQSANDTASFVTDTTNTQPSEQVVTQQQGAGQQGNAVQPAEIGINDVNKLASDDQSGQGESTDFAATGAAASVSDDVLNRVSAEQSEKTANDTRSRLQRSNDSPQQELSTEASASSTPEHVRLAEATSREQSAGQNSALVQGLTAPPTNTPPASPTAQPAAAHVAPAPAGATARTATDANRKPVAVVPAVETTAIPAAATNDVEAQPTTRTATTADDDAAVRPANATGTAVPAKSTRVQGSVNPAHQFERLASLVQQSERLDRTISVRLHPPELGALQIDVSERNGVMTARFEVQTQAAQKILGDSLPKLHDVLAQLGASVERIDVQLVTAEANPDRSGYDNPDQSRQQRERDQTLADGGEAGQFGDQDRSSQSSPREQDTRGPLRHDGAAEQSAAVPNSPHGVKSNPLFRPLDRIDIHI